MFSSKEEKTENQKSNSPNSFSFFLFFPFGYPNLAVWIRGFVGVHKVLRSAFNASKDQVVLRKGLESSYCSLKFFQKFFLRNFFQSSLQLSSKIHSGCKNQSFALKLDFEVY